MVANLGCSFEVGLGRRGKSQKKIVERKDVSIDRVLSKGTQREEDQTSIEWHRQHLRMEYSTPPTHAKPSTTVRCIGERDRTIGDVRVDGIAPRDMVQRAR